MARFNIGAWSRAHSKKSKARKRRGSHITHKPKRSMARKKSSHKRSGGMRSKLGGISGIVKKAAAGIGMASIAVAVTDRVAPQFSPVARIGGAFYGGGLEGVVADVVLSGGLSTFGSLFGGGQQTQSVAMDAI